MMLKEMQSLTNGRVCISIIVHSRSLMAHQCVSVAHQLVVSKHHVLLWLYNYVCAYCGVNCNGVFVCVCVCVSVCRTKYNLNALSHDTAIGLIRKVLADGVNLTQVYTVVLQIGWK